MRLRNIKGSFHFIDECPYVVDGPEQWKGRWQTLFPKNNPIHLEIGVGKGRFIRTLASQNPGVNYIGMEKFTGVLYRTVREYKPDDYNNLLFIRMDAENIHEAFDTGEISAIYLNFSDPWPKKRHAKRRLTSKNFLAGYQSILNPQGILQFKTDNKELFEFSLTQMKEANWNLTDVTYDLHRNGLPDGVVMTEYEEKFNGMGCPIYSLTACPTPIHI